MSHEEQLMNHEEHIKMLQMLIEALMSKTAKLELRIEELERKNN